MARITVEDCLDKAQNRFALVLLVSKRGKQLIKGDQCLAPGKDNKPIVNSLREVAGGYVYFDVDESQGTAQQQMEKDLAR